MWQMASPYLLCSGRPLSNFVHQICKPQAARSSPAAHIVFKQVRPRTLQATELGVARKGRDAVMAPQATEGAAAAPRILRLDDAIISDTSNEAVPFPLVWRSELPLRLPTYLPR